MKVEDIVKIIKKVDIDTLTLDPDNPNIMEPQEEERLAKSLDVYGFLYPLIVDQNNIILDGNHRYVIYKNRGMKQVPIIQMEFKSESQRRLVRQSLNKIHGTHDLEKDIKELEIIMEQDAEMLKDLIGVTEDDLDDMRKAASLIEPEFKVPKEKPEKVMSDIGIKRVLHIPVSEELLAVIEQIMENNDIEDHEELLEWLVGEIQK